MSRYRSLDGLRGVGAVVVMVYHSLLVVPAVSMMYLASGTGVLSVPAAGTIEWWLYATPLRLLWGGHEAVLVFFALSGFVLTLPLVARGPDGKTWLAYYVRRLCRLYLPVWASLVFAVLLATVISRSITSGSTWLASHKPPTIGSFLHDALLLLGTSNLNSPLWSLRWEMWFSLLLPLMFVILRMAAVRRWAAPAVALFALVSACSQLPVVKQDLPESWMTQGLLEYLPIFAIGMSLALAPKALAAFAHRVQSAARPSAAWWGLIAAGWVLAASPTYAPVTSNGFLRTALQTLSIVGVSLIVVLALTCPTMTRMLESKPLQWAGSRSFSIYLIHEPILVSLALLTRAHGYLPWLFVAAAAIPLIFLLAEVFYRAVERPAHRMSRALGSMVRRPSEHRDEITATSARSE